MTFLVRQADITYFMLSIPDSLTHSLTQLVNPSHTPSHSHRHNKIFSLFSHAYHASWYYQSSFIRQLMHKWTVLKNFKIYIKINIKTAPVYFVAVTPSSGSALLVLAKVTVVKTSG